MPLRLGRFVVERRALRSRVARRVFLLFVACALVPVFAFAIFAFRSVSVQLEQDARTQLRTSSKGAGMAVLERLQLLDAALGTMIAEGRVDPGRVDHPLGEGRFLDVRVVQESDLAEALPAASRALHSPLERKHLASGGALLVTTEAGEEAVDGPVLAGVHLVRRDPVGQYWIGRIDPEFLWQTGALSSELVIAVYDAAGRLIFGSGGALPPPPAQGRQSGLRWEREGELALGESWELFLRSLYRADSWRLVQYRLASQVMAPMRSFQAIFLMVSGLALALVVMFSISQIRRQLVPMETLHAATAQIAGGDWSTRVEIESRDEFRDLGASFNEMAESIQDLRENLEEKVRVRTRELADALEELRATQAQLVHREKMASVGQFVAGIAHEINNPVAFIEGNMHFLQGYVQNLTDAIEGYEGILRASGPDLCDRMEALRSELDLEYVLSDMKGVMEGCAEGTRRTTTLVNDLRTFSRLDSADCLIVDLHDALESTLNLLRSRLLGIEIVREYGDLPPVECLASQLNQVFMNLIANAADASEEGDRIVLRTQLIDDERIAIEIEDEGCGMDEETVAKVFDPFFTTKPVGQGTGLGLSISYGVLSRHAGSISVRSEPGVGTCFRMELPIRYAGQSAADGEADAAAPV